MITRPLDLASRLRPEPRNLDWVFFVNTGLLVLFFSLFGSRFVLAPGLGVDLPQLSGVRGGVAQPTHYISVTRAGLIFSDAGPVTMEKLKSWLTDEGEKWRLAEGTAKVRPALLVRAHKEVQMGTLAEIANAAGLAGFAVAWAAEDSANGEGGRP
jgi:biopolymer transport protein ExbD